MAPLLVGGQMDKKCMFGHIHKARELAKEATWSPPMVRQLIEVE